MFDSIGFPELVLIAVVSLLILGPERLPETLRTASLWLGRARRSFASIKSEIEKEIGMDEIRQQLHNEAVMEEIRKLEQDAKNFDTTTNAEMTNTLESSPAEKHK
ncbi:MAG: Sec-independent protein translocase protein TatB [Pseudomonadales bacterium]|nr:Sec-independent protein translocase protein TatB [Pseudomonadales bacterium]